MSGLVCEIFAIFCAKYPENPNTENGRVQKYNGSGAPGN